MLVWMWMVGCVVARMVLFVWVLVWVLRVGGVDARMGVWSWWCGC
jgi:hypothetical protein